MLATPCSISPWSAESQSELEYKNHSHEHHSNDGCDFHESRVVNGPAGKPSRSIATSEDA